MACRRRRPDRRTTGMGWLTVVVALVFLAVALPACGGNDEGAGNPEAATGTDAADATSTAAETETGPEPVTDAERRWARIATQYIDRAERRIFHEGSRVITRASMRSEIALFERC